MKPKSVSSPLKWFFSFINEDLSQLTWSDRLRFHLDMAEAFRVTLERSDLEEAPVNPEWTAMCLVAKTETLVNLQNKFRSILSDLKEKIDNVESAAASHQSDDILPEKYLEMTRLQAGPVTIQLTLSIEPSSPPEFTLIPQKSKRASLVHWDPLSFKTGHLDVKVSSKNLEPLMIYHFLQALRDLPIQSVRQCPQCEKWFVSKNVRGQVFCSGRCATRKANKDRYYRKKSESPAKYAEELEQGKARAKKSYEQKIRQIKVTAGSEKEKITNEEE